MAPKGPKIPKNGRTLVRYDSITTRSGASQLWPEGPLIASFTLKSEIHRFLFSENLFTFTKDGDLSLKTQ